MCEIFAAALSRPMPYGRLHPWVLGLEQYGLGGFGWGVCWVVDGSLRIERGLGRYTDEAPWRRVLDNAVSDRFLVHLRRPSNLSTVSRADTQPFISDEGYAFCHNGFFERAEEYRPRYAGRLHGFADSEVGWQFFVDRIGDGVGPVAALQAVDDAFAGEVNLGYIDARKRLAVYTRSKSNPMWRFSTADGLFATTALHSHDESVFERVIRGTDDKQLLAPRASLDLDAALPTD